jgi:TonB-linked SusC/RagA family outer membrane protein
MLLCLSSAGSILAQDSGVTVSGKITDAKNEPIIGAAIVLEGTTKGVASDLDGNYKISGLPKAKVNLVFTAIGYAKQRKSLDLSNGSDQSLNISLQDDALQLDQVVVVGYGLEQKRDVTGAITTIKSAEINNSIQPSLDQVLQGRASGVLVTGSSGVAGTPVKVNIRGTNSISAGAEPLYVIDGIPMTTGDFSPGNLGSGTSAIADLNPADIESMEVLKDAAATAIYGSRGANGVILITTKKGKAGKTKFDFGYSYGMVDPTNRLDFLSAEEHLALRDQASIDKTGNAEDKKTVVGAWNNRGFTRAQADSFVAASGGSDWISTALRRGAVQAANLSAQGGNEKTTYYIGGTYRNEKGFLVGSDFERFNTRLSLDNQATERLKLSMGTNFAYTINRRVPMGDDGGLGAAQQRLPFIPIYNSDGSFNDPYANPAWQLSTREFTSRGFRNISNISAQYQILPGLIWNNTFGMDLLNQWESEFNFRNTQDTGSVSSAWDRRTTVFNWTAGSFLAYNRRYNDLHSVGATLGAEAQKSDTRGVGLQGIGFSNDALKEPSNAQALNGYNYATGFTFNSFFGRLNYKFKDRYIFEVSMRRDGSSRFGPGNRYGYFPAASGSWIVSDEAWMKSLSFISFMKLRSSYGFTGNANIGDYAWRGIFFTIPQGYNGSSGIAPGSLQNPDLRWERAQGLDLGIDIAFFNNRLAFNVNYFNKQSKDLIYNVNVPTSSGFGSILLNRCELVNKGWEITMNTKNFDGKFSWYTDVNLAFIRNEVTDVADLPPDAFESGQPGEGRVILGYPVGQTYVVEFAGVQQSDGTLALWNADGSPRLDAAGNQATANVKAGTELFYDSYGNLMTFANPTGSFYDHRRPFGNPIPKVSGGITNTFSYMGFDLGFLFTFAFGHTIYDDPAKQQIGNWTSVAQRPQIQDAWTTTNASNEVPGLNNYTAINSTRFLYDASYVRLRNITLGYNLPKKVAAKAKMELIRVFVTGANVWTWTRYPGWDPEVLRNVNPNSQQGNVSFSGPSFQTPQARIISAGVKLNF